MTITMNITGFFADVTETLPDGWEYESEYRRRPSNVGVEVDHGSQQMISFIVLADQPAVTYTVTAPDMDSIGTFSGTFSGLTGSDVAIGGATTVTVGTGGTDPVTPEPVNRLLPNRLLPNRLLPIRLLPVRLLPMRRTHLIRSSSPPIRPETRCR